MADTQKNPNKIFGAMKEAPAKVVKEVKATSKTTKAVLVTVPFVTGVVGFFTGRATKKAPKSAKAAAPKSN